MKTFNTALNIIAIALTIIFISSIALFTVPRFFDYTPYVLQQDSKFGNKNSMVFVTQKEIGVGDIVVVKENGLNTPALIKQFFPENHSYIVLGTEEYVLEKDDIAGKIAHTIKFGRIFTLIFQGKTLDIFIIQIPIRLIVSMLTIVVLYILTWLIGNIVKIIYPAHEEYLLDAVEGANFNLENNYSWEDS